MIFVSLSHTYTSLFGTSLHVQRLFASNSVQLSVCLLEEVKRNKSMFGICPSHAGRCLPKVSTARPSTATQVFITDVWQGEWRLREARCVHTDELPNLCSFHIMAPPVLVQVLGTDDYFGISAWFPVIIKASKPSVYI